MTKIKRLVAVALAFLMIFGSITVTASAWDAATDDGFDLNIKTKIFRQVNGTWTETEKVKRGESVKARVYLNTTYFANAGELLFFYNNDFFEDAYTSSIQPLAVNSYYQASPYSISGQFYGSKSASKVADQMVNAGRITADFAAANNFFIITYRLENLSQRFTDNQWFCEFDLKVKEDASGTGRFFAVEETTLTPDFTFGKINVSKSQYNKTVISAVSMANWRANYTYSDVPVTLYNNFVNVTFNANGGRIDGKETAVVSGEAGAALTAPVPQKFASTFVGWALKGTTDATTVNAFPAEDTEYVAVWTSRFTGDETVAFKTEIFRLDEATGEWIYTERVKPGEKVKARIYVDTNYFTNAGDILVFYDNTFFTDDYVVNQSNDVVFNSDPESSAAKVGASGQFARLNNATNSMIKDIVREGYVTQDFVDTHNAYTMWYKYEVTTGKKLSGDKWFAEFDLTVLDSASGWGNFFFVEQTVQTEDRQFAFVNIPINTDGGLADDSIGMYAHTINIEIDDKHPVCTYSTITFDANGGAFTTGSDSFVYPTNAGITANIGDAVDASLVPEVSKDGATFMGWVDASVENPTVDDVIAIPTELGYDDITLKALWINKVDITFVYNDGVTADETVTVTAGDAFVAPADPTKEGNHFVGWTSDATFEEITGFPAVYPTEDTTYYAVFSTATYDTRYYVSAADKTGFEFVGSVNSEYGSAIVATPPAYVVPEGYKLSPAYTDISLTTLLPEGATVPAHTVKLYFGLIAETYDVIFDANGGAFADGSVTKNVATQFDTMVVAPEAPTKEGCDFAGWTPDLGYLDTTETVTYYATWTPKTYDAVFYSDGVVYDTIPTEFGTEIDEPAPPEKEGYTFVGWTPALPDTMPAENVRFDAVFEANTYKATFYKSEEDKAAGTVYDESEVKFGETITTPDDPTKEGYIFSGWTPSVPSAMPASDLEFVATWSPRSDTPYKVEIYEMDTTGNYSETPKTVSNKTGITDSTVTADTTVLDGFYVDTDNSVLTGTVAADGSTVLKVYYARNQYDITFDGNGGKVNGNNSVELKFYHGAIVTAPADVVREGYTFAGWNPTVATVATADAVYTAQWNVNSYDVIYMADGVEFARDSFDFGTKPTPTGDKPSKVGYTFIAWDAELPETMPANDIVLNAVFKADTFDARFYLLADKSDDPIYKVIPTKFGDPIATPDTTPTKVGYTFEGWSLDGETVLDDLGIMDSIEGKDFIAVWKAANVSYLVKVYMMDVDGNYPDTPSRTQMGEAINGTEVTITPEAIEHFTVDTEKSVLTTTILPYGTEFAIYYSRNEYALTTIVDGVSNTESYYYEAPVTAPADPVKEGYTFSHWAATPDGADEVTIPATLTEDLTVYAVFTKNTYKVTYIDGEDKTEYDAVDFGDAIPVPANPSKVGYLFLGWKDADGKKPSDYGVMPARDLEFTAEWQPNTDIGYTLEIYEMGTDGAYPENPTSVIRFNDGIVGQTRAPEFTVPTGFTLDTAKSVTSGVISVDPTLVLKAYLSRNQYKLTYINEGEEYHSEDVYYGQTINAVTPPTKEGYSFDGWDPQLPAVMPANDVTVTAKWSKNKYPANFDAGEGAFPNGEKSETVEVPYGEKITAPETEPTREGYEFKGWADPAAPDTVITDFGNIGTDGADFVAVWEASQYTVTFYSYMVDPHTDITASTPKFTYDEKENVPYGSTVEFPADPSIDYFVFTGWVDEDGNAVEPGITMPAHDLKIYATFKRIVVKLVPKAGSTTIVERDGAIEKLADNSVTPDRVYPATEGNFSEWFIYGLKTRLTEEVLRDQFIDVLGDGRIEITAGNPGTSNYTGTGTKVEVYDNVTNELVETFYIIIYGDLNGDSLVNATDVSIASDESLQITRWSKKGDTYMSYRFKAANIKKDNYINATDVSLISDHSIVIGVINQETGLIEYE